MTWQTQRTGHDYDLLAPDGSEIRLLTQLERGSMVHCTLRPGQITQAVRHRTVEELWFCISGSGELWRSDGSSAEVVELRPRVSVSIPCGVSFQFRAGADPLELVITTMPPWPGADEALAVAGFWTAPAT